MCTAYAARTILAIVELMKGSIQRGWKTPDFRAERRRGRGDEQQRLGAPRGSAWGAHPAAALTGVAVAPMSDPQKTQRRARGSVLPSGPGVNRTEADSDRALLGDTPTHTCAHTRKHTCTRTHRSLSLRISTHAHGCTCLCYVGRMRTCIGSNSSNGNAHVLSHAAAPPKTANGNCSSSVFPHRRLSHHSRDVTHSCMFTDVVVCTVSMLPAFHIALLSDLLSLF